MVRRMIGSIATAPLNCWAAASRSSQDPSGKAGSSVPSGAVHPLGLTRSLVRSVSTSKCTGPSLPTSSLAKDQTSVTEVFSTDWSLGGGQDEGCGDDGTDALRT